jgi:CRP/FNR family transcriptional regulator
VRSLDGEQLLQLSKHSTRRTVEPGNRAGWRKPEDKDLFQHHFRRRETVEDDGRWAPADCRSAVRTGFSRPSVPAGEWRQREAATEVKVCSFSKAADRADDLEMPELEHKLLEQTLNELDEARDWMLTLGRKTAGEKVASFLLLIATHAFPDNESDTVTFDLPMSRTDIADFLGLTMETVSRQLTKLRKDDVIRIVNNRHVTIARPDTAVRPGRLLGRPCFLSKHRSALPAAVPRQFLFETGRFCSTLGLLTVFGRGLAWNLTMSSSAAGPLARCLRPG